MTGAISTHELDEGEQLAQAAHCFVGTPFRLYGRDARTGLDCIGLVLASLTAIGRTPCAPEGYRLRNRDAQRWFACATRSGLVETSGPIRSGDVVMLQPGPGQHHIAIATSNTTLIHAHAGLRRVVLQTMAPSQSLTKTWRLPDLEN